MNTITVAVPAYSRPDELGQLIDSVLSADVLPDELLICEDKSPRRAEIRAVIESMRPRFAAGACALTYIENEENLGYDGNIRKIIASSASDYVLILGDDDVLFKEAIPKIRAFVQQHPQANFISRTFSRFAEQPQNIINTTWIRTSDCVIKRDDADPNIIFRLCGFVGGLVINRRWASQLATEKYDGYLYYQFYLACLAYLGDGIGYISASTVGGRAGNPPLFGSADSEKDTHIPGSYRPKGRAKMWQGLLAIAADIDKAHGSNIYPYIRNELAGRQAYHIFEMMPAQGRAATLDLFHELRRLKLTHKAMPWLLTSYILVFGSYARIGFALSRRLQFAIEQHAGLKL
ncbi:glycosyltransferase family 2 protein [Chromobacterium subtsugae]|uniref:glycosyltransferase family 2 protein n=1 Tax=Chromobacterium subtsugae TaxID=251747 RepID=UPI0006414D91|nr:glycosyltransferase family 2 protein [Chromobacterium subtsugae]